MKNTKLKVLSVISAAALTVGLGACGSDSSAQSDNGSQSDVSQSDSGQSGEEASPDVDRDPTFALPKIDDDSAGKPQMTPVDEQPPENITVKILKKGDGDIVKPDDTVTVDYAGFLWDNGDQFDSSFERGEAATFSLNQVIAGWKWGLAEVPVGSRVELIIPPKYGYGDVKQGDIPANSTLVFVVDMKAAHTVSADALKEAKPTEEKTPAGIVIKGEIGEEPSITFEPSAKAPTKAETIELAQGTGRVITDTDIVSYYGVGTLWGTDSQPNVWEQTGVQEAPAGAPELVGRKVGSRLLLITPGAGDQVPAQALIVDILAAIPQEN